MSKEELLEKMREANKISMPEERHRALDKLLLDFIADDEVTKEYNQLEKWYS